MPAGGPRTPAATEPSACAPSSERSPARGTTLFALARGGTMTQTPRRRFLIQGGGALVALGPWRPGRVEATPSFDLLIEGGTVLDGTGAPAFVAGVAVKGDAIAAVGEVAASQAARVVDARGLHVCPGFVDMHSHSDGGILV